MDCYCTEIGEGQVDPTPAFNFTTTTTTTTTTTMTDLTPVFHQLSKRAEKPEHEQPGPPPSPDEFLKEAYRIVSAVSPWH